MNRILTALLLCVCLLMCGCASLLERSYSSVEPYTDRYWDSGAEDILKAENYQDLVNSLLLLIEQRSEEVVIHYYAREGTDTYAHAINAKYEIQNETLLGSYLLNSLTLTYTGNNGYCTLTYSMSYRADAQDISTLMALSDSQSLVDLLRVALREEHGSVTARFVSKMSREEVLSAVTALWQELYLEELEANGYFDTPTNENGSSGDAQNDTNKSADAPNDADENPESPPDQNENEQDSNSGSGGETGSENETGNLNDTLPNDGAAGEDHENEDPEDPIEDTPSPLVVFPPCPWEIIFYPDADTAEIVTIILK